jgi:hypothetical protein
MAIKFGMTVAQMIGQLTRGFMKTMGRKPDGLEKIKIQQEAIQRFKDMNKVVDMEGNVIDTSKGIMGGQQVGQKGMFDNIFARMQKDMGKNLKEVKTKNRPDVYDLDDYDTTNMSDIKKEIIRTETKLGNLNPESKGFREKAKELVDKIEELKGKMRDDKAMGGRIGYKIGSIDKARRAFLKTAAGVGGGIAALKTGLLGLSKKAPEAVEKVTENFSTTLSEAPDYFFNLVSKIKSFGKKSKIGPQERVDEYSYIGKNGDQYTLTEDIVTGDAQIVKDKMGVGSYGDKTFDTINDRTVMEYKSPRQDVDLESGRGTREAAEYEEYKIEFDSDGTEAGADAIDEIVQKEIIEEAATKSAPSIKKAGGGLAYMLGE